MDMYGNVRVMFGWLIIGIGGLLCANHDVVVLTNEYGCFDQIACVNLFHSYPQLVHKKNFFYDLGLRTESMCNCLYIDSIVKKDQYSIKIHCVKGGTESFDNSYIRVAGECFLDISMVMYDDRVVCSFNDQFGTIPFHLDIWYIQPDFEPQEGINVTFSSHFRPTLDQLGYWLKREPCTENLGKLLESMVDRIKDIGKKVQQYKQKTLFSSGIDPVCGQAWLDMYVPDWIAGLVIYFDDTRCCVYPYDAVSRFPVTLCFEFNGSVWDGVPDHVQDALKKIAQNVYGQPIYYDY